MFSVKIGEVCIYSIFIIQNFLYVCYASTKKVLVYKSLVSRSFCCTPMYVNRLHRKTLDQGLILLVLETLNMHFTWLDCGYFYIDLHRKYSLSHRLTTEFKCKTGIRTVWVGISSHNFGIYYCFSASKKHSSVYFISSLLLISIQCTLSALPSPFCLSGSTYCWEKKKKMALS